MVRYRALLWLLLLAAPLTSVDAQSVARTVAVLDFVPLTPGANPALAPVFADSIALQLGKAGYKVVDRAATQAAAGQGLLGRDQAMALAQQLKADAIVVGFYGIEGKVLTGGVRAYDVLSGRLAVASVEAGESGLAVLDTIDTMATTVVAKIRTRLPDLAPTEVVVTREETKVETVTIEEVVEKGTLGTLTVLSPVEGAQIFVGDRVVGTIADGKATVAVKLGAPVVLTQTLAGWHSSNTVIASPEQGATVRLPELYRLGNWEWSAAWAPQTPFGLTGGVDWHLIPDEVTLEGTLGAFAVTTEFPPQAGTAAFGFYRADVMTVWRFLPVDFPVRFALGAGLGSFVVAPGALLAAAGIELLARGEYNTPRWRLFTEVKLLNPTLTLTSAPSSVFGLFLAVSGGFAWKL